MDIRRFDPDDGDAVRGWAAVRTASSAHDAPWEHEPTEHFTLGQLRHGWDGEPQVPFLGTVGGVPVAAGAISTSERDNLHVAWVSVDVLPDRRRQGLGTTMLRHLEAEAARMGRTSVGISCWDVDGLEAFGLAHGYERRAVGVNRRQYIAEIDARALDVLHDEAAAAAADYELVRRRDRTPDDELEALAVMASAINDAPKEGLDIEDEVFDAARIRAYDDAQVSRGFALHRLVARHRRTGELAGQTVVVVDLERPHLADQHDTSVVAAHRGHRLGALLKTGMLQWLREDQPQVAEIDTWNAESNGFMIGVNEALGYRVMGREFDLQRSL
ncbi:GNAT family N-acetyltransferase [Nocardioides sp.]|uniref:GNAT family N-acetyltransferase n=1 Tax=Nocardioides sp. TaxID=35761 RepID=UPI00271C8579|nr:GNAT family N-acetyltransferase [Nocardioides sp.]MDO9456274.1 GNAT family N-acetyltransferase [Nocardioides sp.]